MRNERRTDVDKCLRPYFCGYYSCLEIGCGGGYWMENYLISNFKHTIGIDVLPKLELDSVFTPYNYIEAPDQDYSCYGVQDESIDFIWSFGVFCHLPLHATLKYLEGCIRVLKPGGQAVLFFSNTDRRDKDLHRPLEFTGDTHKVGWCKNNWAQTKKMMTKAGFVGIKDILPDHGNTMAYGEKP